MDRIVGARPLGVPAPAGSGSAIREEAGKDGEHPGCHTFRTAVGRVYVRPPHREPGDALVPDKVDEGPERPGVPAVITGAVPRVPEVVNWAQNRISSTSCQNPIIMLA